MCINRYVYIYIYLYIVFFLSFQSCQEEGVQWGRKGFHLAVVALPQEHAFHKAGKQHTACKLASSEKIFKVTVAEFASSLLVFGGGGNVFIGKALCG